MQHRLTGPGAAHLIEKITPSSTASLQTGNSTLSCLLHPATGGIVDDTVITRLGPELFYLVTNAACKAKDIAYLEGQIGSSETSHGTLDWEVLDHWGLVALQGPLSADILQRALVTAGVENVDLKALYFGQCKHVTLKLPLKQSSLDPATPILISRGGYTGEDGFEISIPPPLSVVFTTHLLDIGGRERLRLAGLGARDSLRLEAGMCLYGHDLDDTITPVEAGLGWIVHKDRRDSGGFHGDLTILRQLRPVKDGGLAPKHRRIGLIVEGAPAREGAVIIDPASPDAEVVGRVTSGCPSPTLGKNIAMGYVRPPLHKAGTPIEVLVRGKRRKAEVVKMPFVRSNYWKQAAGTSPG